MGDEQNSKDKSEMLQRYEKGTVFYFLFYYGHIKKMNQELHPAHELSEAPSRSPHQFDSVGSEKMKRLKREAEQEASLPHPVPDDMDLLLWNLFSVDSPLMAMVLFCCVLLGLSVVTAISVHKGRRPI